MVKKSDMKVKTEQFMHALASMVKHRPVAYAETEEEAMDLAQENSEMLRESPLDLRNASLLPYKVPVVSALVLSRNRKLYDEMTEDLQDHTHVCVDSHLSGKEGLFLIRKFGPGREIEVAQYARRLHVACGGLHTVLISKSPGDCSVVAFQMVQLFK